MPCGGPDPSPPYRMGLPASGQIWGVFWEVWGTAWKSTQAVGKSWAVSPPRSPITRGGVRVSCWGGLLLGAARKWRCVPTGGGQGSVMSARRQAETLTCSPGRGKAGAASRHPLLSAPTPGGVPPTGGFIFNSLSIGFACHTIHPFKVCSSVTYSMFTELCSQPGLGPEGRAGGVLEAPRERRGPRISGPSWRRPGLTGSWGGPNSPIWGHLHLPCCH